MTDNELRDIVQGLKKLRSEKIITEDDYALIVTRIVAYQVSKENHNED